MQGKAGQARQAWWLQNIEEAAHGRTGTFDYRPLDVQKAIETVHLLAKQKKAKVLKTLNTNHARYYRRVIPETDGSF